MKGYFDIAEVVSLLKEYRPFDRLEKKYVELTLDWLMKKPTNPLNKKNYNPGHITGSAMIINRTSRKVLLIHHSKLGRWLQPGGHAEPNEKFPLDIAIREIKEETGIKLKRQELMLLDIDVHKIPSNKKEPEHFHYDFRYLAFVDSHYVIAATDAIKAKWFSFKKAISLTSDDGINRMIMKIERINDV